MFVIVDPIQFVKIAVLAYFQVDHLFFYDSIDDEIEFVVFEDGIFHGIDSYLS